MRSQSNAIITYFHNYTDPLDFYSKSMIINFWNHHLHTSKHTYTHNWCPFLHPHFELTYCNKATKSKENNNVAVRRWVPRIHTPYIRIANEELWVFNRNCCLPPMPPISGLDSLSYSSCANKPRHQSHKGNLLSKKSGKNLQTNLKSHNGIIWQSAKSV